jgi:hypothetical protein
MACLWVGPRRGDPLVVSYNTGHKSNDMLQGLWGIWGPCSESFWNFAVGQLWLWKPCPPWGMYSGQLCCSDIGTLAGQRAPMWLGALGTSDLLLSPCSQASCCEMRILACAGIFQAEMNPS